MTDLRTRIRTASLARGLSQAGLSKKSGLIQSVISMVESGRCSPNIESLKKLALGLEVTSDWLLGIERSNKGLDFMGLKSSDFIRAWKVVVEFLKKNRR